MNGRKSHFRAEASLRLFVSIALVSVLAKGSPRKQPDVRHVAAAQVNGTITVDIEGQGIYWTYTIHPADGTVTEASELAFDRKRRPALPTAFAKPAGAITACKDNPTAVSPDGRFIATCVEVVSHTGQYSISYSYYFVVTDSVTHTEVLRWIPSEWRHFSGFAWSLDSKGVAVLTSGEYYGKGPLERLSGAAGHPVPHNTVYLNVFEVDGWKRTEYMVRTEVKYAFTRILSWQ